MHIDQAVFGYSDGHELLAASALRPAERDQLERLTDLSGYVPTGFSFSSYLSGFPVGDRYALCRTWPDTDAPRKGAVLTHVLLLPFDALDQHGIDVLVQLHRRPARPARGAELPALALPGQTKRKGSRVPPS